MAIINIAALGANGTDSNDDRTAIQNAINAAVAGDTVYFPNGTYYLSGGIVGKTGVKLIGQDTNLTILKFIGTADASMINLSNQTNIEIAQLTIDGNHNSRALHGIFGNKGGSYFIHHSNFKDFTATGFQSYGIYLVGSANNEISDNTFVNIGVTSDWAPRCGITHPVTQQIVITPPASAPLSPWTEQDIGSAGVTGGSTVTVSGAGSDIGGTADSFHFVHRTLSGDGEIIARVTSVQNTNINAKAGVMIRETLALGSKHAMMNRTPGGEAQFLRRTATNGPIVSSIHASVSVPIWVRLVRNGNTFTGYRSADGNTWTMVGSATISMTANVYVGVAVVSKNTEALNASTFDHVTVLP